MFVIFNKQTRDDYPHKDIQALLMATSTILGFILDMVLWSYASH